MALASSVARLPQDLQIRNPIWQSGQQSGNLANLVIWQSGQQSGQIAFDYPAGGLEVIPSKITPLPTLSPGLRSGDFGSVAGEHRFRKTL